MEKIIIPVKGMHCRSCEMLIEERLSQIPEIKKSRVNYKKSIAEIYYGSQKPNEGEIEDAIRSAGYSIGSDDKRYLLSSNPEDYKDLGIAFLFLVGIYLVLKNFGILNFGSGLTVSNPSSLWMVLLVGLTAGFSTCMALVGGLALGISARHAEKHPEAKPLQKFRPHIFFNIGRITSYAILGGVLGALGSVFQFSSLTLGVLTIAVGIVMLVMGLQLVEIFPIVSGIKFTLPKFISHVLGIKNHAEEYSHRGAFTFGALTFFLPCGFTQAMQFYAMSTGSFATGALVMGAFALGTVPGLLGIGGITSVVKGIFAKRFFKFAGLLVIFFSLFNISNGYNLTGWQIGSGGNTSNVVQINDPNVKMENGVQVVRMTENSRGYSPNNFTVKKGISVKWIIDAQDPFSCASSLTISKLGIRKSLKAGENIIEFTPKDTGVLKFSCSMGMYTGVFNVVDEEGSGASAGDQDDATQLSSGTCGAGGGGCGGCGGGASVKTNSTPVVAETTQGVSSREAVHVIKTTYTNAKYLDPSVFKVKAGTRTRLEIDVRDDYDGCGGGLTIWGLYNSIQPLRAGVPVTLEFVPTTPGTYDMTCGMGMVRFGSITVE